MAATERADAVVLGPGLGREADSFALAQDLAELVEKPLLIDADGLNALAESGLEVLAGRDRPTVLTPHAGELGRLLGRPSAEVEAHRLAAAREAAQRVGSDRRAEGRRHARGRGPPGSRASAWAAARGSRQPAPATS